MRNLKPLNEPPEAALDRLEARIAGRKAAQEIIGLLSWPDGERRGRPPKMIEHKITLPADWNCRVSGAIVESDDHRDLSEDMLEVALPSGVLVCAGSWEGCYVISATRGLVDVEPPIFELSAIRAVQVVERLAGEYRQPPGGAGGGP